MTYRATVLRDLQKALARNMPRTPAECDAQLQAVLLAGASLYAANFGMGINFDALAIAQAAEKGMAEYRNEQNSFRRN